MNANGRLCRRFKHGFKDVAKLGRPVYKATSSLSVAQAIARERAQAARMAAAKGKKKK
jgi:hypothetical protein